MTTLKEGNASNKPTLILLAILIAFLYWLISEDNEKKEIERREREVAAEQVRQEELSSQSVKAPTKEEAIAIKKQATKDASDKKAKEEQAKKEAVREAPVVPYGKDRVVRAIKRELDSYGIVYFDVGVAESGCIWVYVLDNGNNRDGLATTLCQSGSGISCVTIFDNRGNELGRSVCR